MTIGDAVNQKKVEYQKTQMPMNPSYAPRQKDLYSLIDFYWMNKFKQGETDSNGMKKAFFNVVVPPSEVAMKLLDLDTKDVQVMAEEGQSYYPAWFFGKDLRIWMKDKKNKDGKTFGQTLNNIVSKWPKYGHLLVKKAKDTIHLVPLQNVINQEDANCILESDLVIETHRYTPDQLRKQGWDHTEEVIKKYKKDGFINILEVHGNVEGSEKYNYFIMPEGARNDEIMFFDKKNREDLYRELKFDDIPGRAVGRGIAERLFESQIAKNQQENWLRSGQRWSSKHIFQTRDNTINKNLVTQIENGDILTVMDEVTPISVEERNLPAYGMLDNKWDRHIQEMTFSYSQVRGERPPAGTPLGTSILQTNLATQYYDIKREDLGMFLKDILFDWIIPGFKKQKIEKHAIMAGEFEEDELDKLRNLILTHRANKAVLKYIAKNMKIPSTKEAEILKAIEKEKIDKSKHVEIPAKFYENLRYKIKILITNEQLDVASRMTTLQTILQIIGANPTILKDPRTRKVFYKMIDLAGFSPVDFGIDEAPGIEEVMGSQEARVAGSVARPRPKGQFEQATNVVSL